MRDIISIEDLERSDIEKMFDAAFEIESKKLHKSSWCLLKDKTVILAFFEPSTRTRLSFELASKRLCAHTLSVVGEEAISLAKGESFRDTIKVFDTLGDLIVIRHSREGSARYAAEIAESPVINAGDGRNHHPTQSLIDLYTIKKLKGDIDGLSYAVVGDLRYARTARSFLLALTKFKPKSIYLVAPPPLKPPHNLLEKLRNKGFRIYETEKVEDVINMVDVLYVTRIQRERIPDPQEYERVKGSYRITRDLLRKAKSDLIVLHPLPRLDELDIAIDETKHAAYFEQVKSAVPIRMTALAWSAGVL
ncbi:aspartate carbamoyltransferase [Ignicoccus pacificus DSM 13166]|uniref:Aspartate carbamoyltransferase n=1 Tax=Ignicoccus pacificus DSM 13166 TaxID=940294 RepID=A0A977KC15_9CREN|nr:aspartate carbamoyltransferase [Ignicoccus pacificus DSM 13166]